MQETLDERAYRGLKLLDTSVGPSETAIAFDEAGLAAGGPIDGSVTVDRPPGTTHPAFATTLDRRITDETGREVSVEVRFVGAARTIGDRSVTNDTADS